MKKKYLLGLLLSGGLFMSQSSASELKLLTENYPPYNMEIKGELKGLAIDVLDSMLENMGNQEIKNNIKIGAWSRVYSYAKNKKNHMVFSTTRTDEREKLFKWVGPIVKSKIGIITLKNSNIKITNISDLNKYTIGAVKKDIGQSLLIKAGVDNIKSSGGASAVKTLYKKLTKGKIDMFAYETVVSKYIGTKNGYSTDDFKVAYVLKEADLYFAFNIDTSDEIITKWQKSLDTIKEAGTLAKIIKKYQ